MFYCLMTESFDIIHSEDKKLYFKMIINLEIIYDEEMCHSLKLCKTYNNNHFCSLTSFDFRCGALLFMIIHVIYKYKK